jgi:hypothetical protein
MRVTSRTWTVLLAVLFAHASPAVAQWRSSGGSTFVLGSGSSDSFGLLVLVAVLGGGFFALCLAIDFVSRCCSCDFFIERQPMGTWVASSTSGGEAPWTHRKRWKGHFTQERWCGQQYGMYFTDAQFDIKEGLCLGRGQDDRGAFKWSGFYSVSQNRVAFTKQYENHSDSLLYIGRVDPNTGSWSGTWWFADTMQSGAFEMAPEPDALQLPLEPQSRPAEFKTVHDDVQQLARQEVSS